MAESTFNKIIRKSGMKPVSCKCSLCKEQCKAPCIGTPEDMKAIVEAGYGDRIVLTNQFGKPIFMPQYDSTKKSCTFFTNGLCELHDKGLKPTVGKLSHHSLKAKDVNLKKTLTVLVLKEW